MKKNKLFSIICLAVSICAFNGCKKGQNEKKGADENKIKVVATIFPEYDWAKNLVKDSPNVEVELLIKNGTDLHSYQPSTQDIVKIGNADIFIYVGGESDEWVSQVLKNSKKENQIVVNLMQTLSQDIKEEELVEGMQGEDHDDDDADDDHDDDEDDDETEYDEHVWLSVENAKKAVIKIAESLEVADLENSVLYASNLKNYLAELESLDTFKTRIAEKIQTQNSPLIFCDRFPFRYLIDELNLKYFAAFAGCSAETEASFETVAFLVKKTEELKPDSIFVTESSDKKLAQTVIAGAKLPETKITVLNSMQAVTLEQAENGASYIKIMQENLEKISSALN